MSAPNAAPSHFDIPCQPGNLVRNRDAIEHRNQPLCSCFFTWSQATIKFRNTYRRRRHGITTVQQRIHPSLHSAIAAQQLNQDRSIEHNAPARRLRHPLSLASLPAASGDHSSHPADSEPMPPHHAQQYPDDFHPSKPAPCVAEKPSTVVFSPLPMPLPPETRFDPAIQRVRQSPLPALRAKQYVLSLWP
jgi:hypothetical protein